MIIKTMLTAIKPFQLLSIAATYLLGAGLVQYVRGMRSWTAFFQGLAFLLLMMISLELLRLIQFHSNPQNWPVGTSLRDARQLRNTLAMVAATLLTVAAAIYIDWVLRGIVWQGLVLILVMILLFGTAYFLAQYKERLKPYQLLLEVFLFVVMPPGAAFFLQSDNPHRLLTLIVVCLVPAFFAYRILIQLKGYGQDAKYEVKTLVTHIGWEKAMAYHNALILLTYFLFALTTFWGFPWFIVWPVFLTLPIGLLEIWLMERVKRGQKPLWKVMQAATISVYFITIYMIGFAFWIR